MRTLYGFLLSALLVAVFIVSYKRNRDIFSPLCIMSIIQFLRYVPHIFNCDYEHSTVLTFENIEITFLYECLFILSVLFGYYFISRISVARRKMYVGKTVGEIRLGTILFIYLIGFASRVYIIMKIGGLTYVINNMSASYRDYSSISGYISALGNLMTLAIIMYIERCSKRPCSKVLLFSMVLFAMASYLIYSSRSPALELLMITIFAYHYLVQKINMRSLLQPKYLIIGILTVSIVSMMPILRNASNNNQLRIDKEFSVGNSFNSIFNEFSYVGRDTFVYSYFDVNNLWYGKTFLNTFVGFIPRQLYSNKPSLDDGNYLNNLMNGYFVSPNDPFDSLPVKTSVPFSTSSSMYANFGLIGIVFGGMLLGVLYKKAYVHLKRNATGMSVILYQLVVYQLELSALSISQTLIPLVVIGIVYKTAFRRLAI